MAPLSPDNTPRFRFHYTVIGKQHTLEVRSGSSPATIGGQVYYILNTLGAKLFASVLDFVDFAASGSNVFNPVTTGVEGNTWGTGAGTVDAIPRFFNFIGRTSGGRRVRMAVFGAIDTGTDYRYLAGENSTVDNARAALVGYGSSFQGIDGLTPIWKSYVNVGYNAYWQRNVRP